MQSIGPHTPPSFITTTIKSVETEERKVPVRWLCFVAVINIDMYTAADIHTVHGFIWDIL